MADDLDQPDVLEFDWSQEKLGASLRNQYQQAIDHAKGAESWYREMRPAKKHWARALRLVAIVLGTVAAILPILSEISTAGGKPAISPGWAAVAIATAAGLVAIERFFGFSSTWMRFMTAELQIARMRREFGYEWNAKRSELVDPLTLEQVQALFTLTQQFDIAVDDIVIKETGQWSQEFQGSLKESEQGLRHGDGH